MNAHVIHTVLAKGTALWASSLAEVNIMSSDQREVMFHSTISES